MGESLVGRGSMSVDAHVVGEFRDRLENHPIYRAMQTLTDLRRFMERHVYCHSTLVQNYAL